MEDIKIQDVKWHPKTNKLCQIPTEGLEFALLSKNYEQISQLAYCKDFLQDSIHGYLSDQFVEIYGFTYDPKKSPAVDLETTRILFTNYKDKEFGDKLFNKCLPLIHQVEDKLKIKKKTVAMRCAKAPSAYRFSGVWIIEGDQRWQMAPPMLSFYAFLIRIGFVYEGGTFLEHLKKIASGEITPYYDRDKPGKYEGHVARDKETAIACTGAIKDILKYGDKKVFPQDMKNNYAKKIKGYYGDTSLSVYTIHDYCGLQGFAKGSTKSNFPEWHTYKDKKPKKAKEKANA